MRQMSDSRDSENHETAIPDTRSAELLVEQEEYQRQERALLRRRAKELAKPIELPVILNSIELMQFKLAYEMYAVETKFISEVIKVIHITPLPHVPHFVLGVINYHGTILSVIDIRKFFDLPGEPLSDLNRLIILRDGEMTFGVLVDRVGEIVDLPVSEILTNSSVFGSVRNEYLKGITQDHIIVLDAKKILCDENIIVK